MVELITEILIYLCLAALIGLVMGYLIWGWGSSARTASARADGAAAIKASADRESRLRDRLAASEREKARLEQEVERLTEAQDQRVSAPDTDAATEPVDPTSMPGGLFDTPPETVDDLKRIKGVGAVMEGVLNDKGIYLYRQLADLNEHEANWVNDAIEAFPGRIHRDGWINQARQLYREKYGETHTASSQRELS